MTSNSEANTNEQILLELRELRQATSELMKAVVRLEKARR